MQDDIQKIEQWATIFDNRILLEETIYLNVLRNYKALGSDILKIIKDVHFNDYNTLGFNIADVLAITLKPLDTT